MERAEAIHHLGWFYTHALLHHWLDEKTSVTNQGLAQEALAATPYDFATVSNLGGPNYTCEATLATAIRDLFAEFDAPSARAD